MRNRRAAWLSLSVLLLLLGASMSSRAARPMQMSPAPLSLLLTDENGARVVGIACDNLRDMPDALLNRLTILLPDALRNMPLSFTLETEEEAKKEAKKEEKRRKAEKQRSRKEEQSGKKNEKEEASVGRVRQEGDRLIYTPPDEFNPNPAPQSVGDILRKPERTVILAIRRADADGTQAIVAQQAILLVRPPVVAVHGVNTSVDSVSWRGSDRLVARLTACGITPKLVDHGQNDFDPRHLLLTPALDFHGNGPVEHGADQLADVVTQALRDMRENQRIAVRRVDLVGYSYGGLISRWYLHRFQNDPAAQQSLRWYTRSANVSPANPLYRLQPTWYTEHTAAQGTEQNPIFNPQPPTPELLNTGRPLANKRPAPNTGRPLVDIRPTPSIPCPVRKLITVASMWRGVPLCNYVNELHAPTAAGMIRLADAPLLGQHIGAFLDRNLSNVLPTRVPSMEVMAVNSPWLTAMGEYQEGGQRKPFLDAVAYGCVAGDDNAFIPVPGSGALLDPYSVLRLAQTPSWFPYLALEHHVGSDHNYSDGLVPLWSAVISDNFAAWHPSRIVRADHDTILASKQAFEYVVCALNNRDWLPPGTVLNTHWNQRITSRELIPSADVNAPQNSPIPDYALNPPSMAYDPERRRKAWNFRPGNMAPLPQNDLYPQIHLLGRIAPDALREIRGVQIGSIRQDSAVVSWHTAAALNGFVAVTRWQQVNFGAFDDVEVNCEVEALGARITQDHRFRVSGLQPNTAYQIIVTSESYDDPDDVVAVRSDVVRFTTRF